MTAASVRFLFVALFGVLLGGCPAQPTSRIMNGGVADLLNFPFMVSIRLDTQHVCGGSIVGPRFILTAAHCVSDSPATPVASSRVMVRAGSTNHFTGGRLYAVSKIYINSGYEGLLNDVAVVELATDLVLGSRVGIIPLAESDDAVAGGDAVTVAGWGSDADDGTLIYKLQFRTNEVLGQSECDELTNYGKPSTLCLQSQPQSGSCYGDGGGPAVANGLLVGVSNFVIGTCGTVYPDIFARVSYFSDWIKSIIDEA